jgi:hypothetical protein
MTNFLSAEFIWRLGIWEGELSGEPKSFPTCRFADFTIYRKLGFSLESEGIGLSRSEQNRKCYPFDLLTVNFFAFIVAVMVKGEVT